MNSTDNQKADFTSASKIMQALEQEVLAAKNQIDSIWPGMPLEEQYNAVNDQWKIIGTEAVWNTKDENVKIEYIQKTKNLIKDVRTFNNGANQETNPPTNKGMTGLIVVLILLFSFVAIWYYIEHMLESRYSVSDDRNTSHKSDSQKKLGIMEIIPNKIGTIFTEKRTKTFNKINDRNKFFKLLGSSIASLSKTKPDFFSAQTMLDSVSSCVTDPLVKEYSEKISYLAGLCSCKKHADDKVNNRADMQTAPSSVVVAKNDSVSSSADIILATQIKTDLNKIYEEAILIQRDDNFFWSVGSKRWKEIYFWALFGIFAGILRWISFSKETGAYSIGRLNREWPWYVTEIIVGPFVVIAVFFIAGKATASLIEGITEAEIKTSIFLTMGLAFVLGFYIRRTIELLLTFANFIKFKSATAPSSESKTNS